MACYEYKGVKYTEGELVKLLQSQQPKTRRILELQSDLFQKGRDKKSLIPQGVEEDENGLWRDVDKESKDPKNKFLQLLNKDNNWVTFFVKSIIQDSAKKGYEKVLFPSGNTASKVEGHTTLEEFKKQKEDRLKELEKIKIQRKKAFDEFTSGKKTREEVDGKNGYFISIKKANGGSWSIYVENEIEEDIAIQEELSNLNSSYNEPDIEINQLKQELERVETEGFGTLKPIYNFYETTVTNILNKQYGKENVKQITDEYGNTWNEIEITNKLKSNILNFITNKGLENNPTGMVLSYQEFIEFSQNKELNEKIKCK